jgi:iron complex outermembrane receptor protein
MAKKIILIAVLAMLLPFSVWASSSNSGVEDLMDMSLDELMNVKVVTAGRQSQKISEAPAAMSVVTAEDIRQLGAVSVSEALRMVVGLHLGHTNAGFQVAGGIRGFHKLPANKIVLLVDGTPWSLQMYDVPGVSQIPVSLEEIERIEVLRGPGSSLYGANAMFGVINVITRKPQDTQGNLFSATAGENKTVNGAMIHSGKAGEKLFYRVGMGWDQMDNSDYIAWASDPEEASWRFNTAMDYAVDDNSSLSFSGAYLSPLNKDLIFESTGPVDWSGADTVVAALSYSAKDPHITLKANIKDADRSNGESFGVNYLNFAQGTRGLEFQHQWKPMARNTLVWGGNFDQKYADGPSIGGRRCHDTGGVFMDNTYSLTRQVALNAGLRLDHHPNTNETLSHRLSFMVAPWERHHFRLTWGTSYRNPDFIESYYSRYSPAGEGRYLHVYGQEDNDPEKASTVELGYNGRLNDKWVVSAGVFYSRLDDFINFVQSGDPYEDSDMGGVVIPYAFMNIGDADQYGLELELNYQITEWLNGIVNYTYIDQKEKTDRMREILRMTPEHMANGQLRAKFKNGISANATVHYKDVTEWRQFVWASPEGNTTAGGRADSYVYATLRVGYEFKMDRHPADVGVTAFNLFNTGFDEYPLDTSDVDRRVTGSFRILF